ncbi:protoporphyrinogen oxidase [Ornithinimicrobium sp. Y1847]|uniref:protoporphyrinogen oxidase n=1 Tax=Ornithinimicrobium sp. Y1847 TaxID=3405419 RepID=UPI003B66EA8E
MPHTLVIGGGISGLAAAHALLTADPTSQVTILEGSDRVGGKIRGHEVAGQLVDVGAEAVLARRPEALDLIDAAGLHDHIAHPTAAPAQVWSRGRLNPLPRRTLMGVPAEADTLHGLLTAEEVARAKDEVLDATIAEGEDISVGQLVTDRLGRAVVDRLVEPLLGGVYAGHADLISARATLPQLLRAIGQGGTLTGTVAHLMPAPTDGTQSHAAAPVFATVTGGLHRLPAALAEHVTRQGATVHTGTLARELHRDPHGSFTVVTGPRPSPTTYRGDRVILALPPAPASRLLATLAPEASRRLGEVETASMAVITVAFPTDALGELTGSGFLVPPVDGRRIKAATFSANKWDWVRELGRGAGAEGADLTYLRASIGRHREESSLQHPDEDLVAAALVDLSAALGRDLPEPVDTHVQRWGGGLPQYAVGHVDLVAAVRQDVARVPGLAVCGATYDGVGIPACIASARRAVTDLLRGRPTMEA